MLSDMSLVHINHLGEHGPNMMRNLDKGLQLRVARPLALYALKGQLQSLQPSLPGGAGPIMPPIQVSRPFLVPSLNARGQLGKLLCAL